MENAHRETNRKCETRAKNGDDSYTTDFYFTRINHQLLEKQPHNGTIDGRKMYGSRTDK